MGIVALTGEGGCPRQIRRRLQVTPNTASVSRTETFVNTGITSLSMTRNAAVHPSRIASDRSDHSGNARRGFGELSQKFGEDPSVFSFQSACGMFAKGPSRHPTAPSPRGENSGFWRLAAFSAEIVATLTAIEFFRHGPRGGRYPGFKAGACRCKRRRGQNPDC
jgi:hypothetical protein